MFGTKFKQYNPFAILGPPIQPRPVFHCWHAPITENGVVGSWPIGSMLCCWCGAYWHPNATVGVAEDGHGKLKPGAKRISFERPIDGCTRGNV